MAADLRSNETKYIDAEIAKAVTRERERAAEIAEKVGREYGEPAVGASIAKQIRAVP